MVTMFAPKLSIYGHCGLEITAPGVRDYEEAVTRPVVVRADPNLARASPECHRSIFLDMGRGQTAEIWQAGVRDYEEAVGKVPEPPRVPQLDLDDLEPVDGAILWAAATGYENRTQAGGVVT